MTKLEHDIKEVERLRKQYLLPILDHGYEQRTVAGGMVKNTRTGFVEEPVCRDRDEFDQAVGSNW